MLRVNLMPTRCGECELRAGELKGTAVGAVDWRQAEEVVFEQKLTAEEVFSICCCHGCAQVLLDSEISGKDYWEARDKKELFDSSLIEIALKKMRERVLGDLQA